MTGSVGDRGARRAALLFVAIPVACEIAWLAHGVMVLPRLVPDVAALAGLVAGAALGWRYWRGRTPASSPTDERGGWVLDLVLLLVVAAPYRLLGLEHHPWYVDHDEGLNGVLSAQLWSHDDWRLIEPGLGVETPFLYLLAFARESMGMSVTSLRLPSAVLGTALVLAIYAFARVLLGRSVARWAGALAAVAPWMVYTSRLAKHAVVVPLLVAITYAVVWTARGRGGRVRWMLAGVLGGLSLYSFTSYRHGPVVATVAALLVGIPRGARGWFALGLAVACAPFAIATRGAAPTDWTGLFASGSAVSLAVEAGDAWILVEAVVASVPQALVMQPAHDTGLGVFLGLAVAFGLPVLLRWGDPRCRLLAWLLVALALPGAIARFHSAAPRRFLGITPVLFALAAWTLLDVRSRLGSRGRRWFTAWLAFLLVVLGLRVIEHAHAMGKNIGAPADHPQRVLRAALEQAIDHDVYLPPGYTGDLPHQRFYLLHPHVHELARVAPWELGVGDRPALVLDAGTELSRAVLEVFPALALTRVARADHGEPIPGGVVPAVARRSFDAALVPVAGGLVAIPADGCYRHEAHGSAILELVGGPVLAPGEQAWLATGLHRYRYPGAPTLPPRLVAHVDGASVAGRPLADLGSRSFDASPARWAGVELLDAAMVDLARGQPWLAAPQDLRVAGRTLLLAYYGGIRRYDLARRAIDPEWLARDRDGEPIGEAFTDQPGELARRTFSIAPLADGGFLVARARIVEGAWSFPGWVRRYGADGRELGDLAPGHAFEEPCDLACAADGRIAVCDARAGRVEVLDAAGALLATHACARPVALAWDGAALVVADAARFELVRIEPDGARTRRFVGALSPRARLRARSDGLVLVADGSIVRAFDRALARVVLGDRFAHVLPADYGALAQLDWDTEGALWVLDGARNLHRLEALPQGPDAAIERVALRFDCRDHAGGTLPIAASTRAAGRYRVWACWAASEARPFTIAAHGQVLACAGTATGGDAKAAARWSPVGELELPAGAVELVIAGGERFYAVALERLGE